MDWDGKPIVMILQESLQKRPVRAAIVGCGGIAHAHAGSAVLHPDKITLVACADVIEERARDFAAKYHIPSFQTDYLALLEREKPDLVFFATWPIQHEEQVLAAIERCVPAILCEKSLAMNAASATRMALRAKETRTVLVEGFMWRHLPRTLEVQRMIAEGRIGKLRKIRAGFHALSNDPDNWRRKKEYGGGVVFDFSCYCVNALGAFAGGLPGSVYAVWKCAADGLIEELYGLL